MDFVNKIVVFALMTASLAAADESISAVATHPVHPLLVRKPACEIARLVIDVPSKAMPRLEEITVSLEGSTTPRDVEKILLFAGPGDASTLGKKPLAEVSGFDDTARVSLAHGLQPGKNMFTIACRLRPEASLDHRVVARVRDVKTSLGSCAPTIEGNQAGQRIGIALRQAGEDGAHTYRIPALATTARGTLLCVYDVRWHSSRDLQADIDVGLSRSLDGGQTWEPMQIIMDMGRYGGLEEKQNGIGDPGILVDHQKGRIFVFALWVHAKAGKHQWRSDGSEPGFEIGKTAQFMLTTSNDEGQTWSPPMNLTRRLKRESWPLFAPSPQQGIQLQEGTLVMPAQGRDEKGEFSTIIVSRDHGETWSVAARAGSGFNECQAVELADGSIMLNARNVRGKRRGVFVTKDLGQTWTTHPTHAQDLIEPTCNGSLYRWTTADKSKHLLLFANPHDEQERIRHTMQASADEGMTWPAAQRLLLDEGEGFGYPSLSRVDDERVGIVYEGSQSHLVFERVARRELNVAP